MNCKRKDRKWERGRGREGESDIKVTGDNDFTDNVNADKGNTNNDDYGNIYIINSDNDADTGDGMLVIIMLLIMIILIKVTIIMMIMQYWWYD